MHIYFVLITFHHCCHPFFKGNKTPRAIEQPEFKNIYLHSAWGAGAQLCLERLKVLLYEGGEPLWRQDDVVAILQ